MTVDRRTGPGRQPGAAAAYWSLAAFFVVYATWGSLLPFDFHAVPLASPCSITFSPVSQKFR